MPLPSSADVSLHPTPGFLLHYMFADPLSTMLKTSGNTPTLLWTWPPSSLPAVSIIPPKQPSYMFMIISSVQQDEGITKVSRLCLLDLSIVFDTVDHSILITGLSSCFGIHGPVLNWLKSFLSSPSFRVRCNYAFSSWCTFSCGVPQSAVLGPLLCFM